MLMHSQEGSERDWRHLCEPVLSSPRAPKNMSGKVTVTFFSHQPVGGALNFFWLHFRVHYKSI